MSIYRLRFASKLAAALVSVGFLAGAIVLYRMQAEWYLVAVLMAWSMIISLGAVGSE